MDTKELIKLIETLKAMGYGHIDITHEGTHVMLDTNSLAGVVAPGTAAAPVVSAPVVTAAPAVQASALSATPAAAAEPTAAPAEEGNYLTIDSPIVGTFYEAASPEADPFVKVGDKVKKGDVVCIIEAMKLMNEIEAECDGEVIEICVSNEGPVEYGQPLFKVRP